MASEHTVASAGVQASSRFTEYDIYLLKQGNHVRLYEKFGAHPTVHEGTEGVYFAVWAPNAESVSVMGDFNGWDKAAHRLLARGDQSGVWEGFVPGVRIGALYKYHVASRYHDFRVDKADPYAVRFEAPGRTASVVWSLDYAWGDADWMRSRHAANARNAPTSIYEIHLGSWRRKPEEGDRFLTYRELADWLPDYVAETGYTHVELLPVTEHPFYGSWGYQTTGYFAPTSRYGTPQDFMYLVDRLHQRGIGVILDWVPSHFPSDEHGLAYFDGTHLYEHADPRMGFHPEWNSYIFNYGRAEVRAFLTSSAVFWLNQYHIDGLRVDAVASMLYLDYARKHGEWIPNAYGGKENLDAIAFLRHLNEAAYREQPDIQMIAEESTAWPMVSRPPYLGGLGFGMKWNMGWMHDTLDYFALDPVYRKFHHDRLTFSIWYAFSENYVLPLSHDEVVYGKGSLIAKMPGDDWRKFANLRLLFGYMYSHPGKKLMFMGGEFGQWREWSHESSLDWHLLEQPLHGGLRRWVGDLNRVYRREPALHARDFEQEGFAWVDVHDWEQSVVSFLRKGRDEEVLVVCNFTPVPRENYRVGVPRDGYWYELLNSDAEIYGGAGFGNLGGVEASPLPAHGHYHSVALTLPPLGIVLLKPA
ncbi:glycogen branching protein [Sulfurifustis variabilis]|uniref:1,4-alpha-glucan branching enzyme GlgB n=1 Tax=Sulfurifustis variabilis TaxID=1675686 RepID=A0A1B4V3B8_9GAMM|nr:1,4-alpha-glucan branching protein GlgB [Sulfurifustis variabilis]BAU48056.1 glycogen branching protein [Sulfurifustis variabilis]